MEKGGATVIASGNQGSVGRKSLMHSKSKQTNPPSQKE